MRAGQGDGSVQRVLAAAAGACRHRACVQPAPAAQQLPPAQCLTVVLRCELIECGTAEVKVSAGGRQVGGALRACVARHASAGPASTGVHVHVHARCWVRPWWLLLPGPRARRPASTFTHVGRSTCPLTSCPRSTSAGCCGSLDGRRGSCRCGAGVWLAVRCGEREANAGGRGQRQAGLDGRVCIAQHCATPALRRGPSGHQR